MSAGHIFAESIVEAALCKSVLKPLKEPIYKSLEKLHASTGSMEQLAQNQVGLLNSYGTTQPETHKERQMLI